MNDNKVNINPPNSMYNEDNLTIAESPSGPWDNVIHEEELKINIDYKPCSYLLDNLANINKRLLELLTIKNNLTLELKPLEFEYNQKWNKLVIDAPFSNQVMREGHATNALSVLGLTQKKIQLEALNRMYFAEFQTLEIISANYRSLNIK